MAIAFRDKAFKTGTAAGSGAVTEPAGAANGDVFVALAVIDQAGSGLTRPTGWTNITNNTIGSPGFDYDISYVVRGASAPNLSWTWTGSVYYEVHILAFSGADNANPLDAQSTVFTSTAGHKGNSQAGSEKDPPSVTAATANTMAVAMGCHWTGSTSAWSAPTNYTLRSDNTAGNDAMMATRSLSSVGAEDPNEFFEGSGDVTNAVMAMVITLKQASAGNSSSVSPSVSPSVSSSPSASVSLSPSLSPSPSSSVSPSVSRSPSPSSSVSSSVSPSAPPLLVMERTVLDYID